MTSAKKILNHKTTTTMSIEQKMTHKEAVTKYLESIPEGGELITGWVKEVQDGSVRARCNRTTQELSSLYLEVAAEFCYYFLRLDMKEGYEVEVDNG